MENFTRHLTTSSSRKNWNVIYTKSRWEKKVDKLLKSQNIQSFCPLVKTSRRWVDRNKIVELPLFNSYLFVMADQMEQLKVKQTLGVVNFVHHCGKPVTIDDFEIERIKAIVTNYKNVEAVSISGIKVGDTLKIDDGLLLDWQGEVVKIQGKSVVMFMQQLNCAIVINVDNTKLTIA